MLMLVLVGIIVIAVVYLVRGKKQSGPDSWEKHVFAHGALDELYVGRMWKVTGRLAHGMPRNMTIYRMPAGGLMLHSVVALDDARMAELERLGQPEVMIVPNGLHRADAAVYKQRYPNIQVVCPQGSRAKVMEKVQVNATCEEYFSKPDHGIAAVSIDGMKPGELAYKCDLGGNQVGADDKKPYGLVVCDFLFNMIVPAKGFPGLISRALGSVGPLKVTPIGKMTFVTNKEAMVAWLRHMADGKHDLRVLTVGHGEPITNDVRSHLRHAAARLAQ